MFHYFVLWRWHVNQSLLIIRLIQLNSRRENFNVLAYIYIYIYSNWREECLQFYGDTIIGYVANLRRCNKPYNETKPRFGKLCTSNSYHQILELLRIAVEHFSYFKEIICDRLIFYQLTFNEFKKMNEQVSIYNIKKNVTL